MKKLNIIYLTVFAGLLFPSCEKQFDKAISPSIVLTDNWRSNLDLEKLTVSSYFMWQGYHEGIGDLGIFIPTMASDEGNLDPSNPNAIEFGNHDLFYNREITMNTMPYSERIWQSGYEVIRSANTVLNFLEKNGPIQDQYVGWTDRMKGENYFCRAFAFYTLVKTFAPPYNSAPDLNASAIIVNTTNSTGAFDTKPLSSIKVAYDQVISDLENAIKYLPEAYDPTRDPSAYQDRAKRDAARFLLARVYFQMGQAYWDKALEQINYIIGDPNKYPLEANPYTPFNQDEFASYGTETVFQYVVYGTKQGWRNPIMYDYFSGTRPTRLLRMSDQFLLYFGWDNATTAGRDLRYKNVYIKAGGKLWANKWRNKNANSALMRVPELYLTRAIIALTTGSNGGKSQAISDLNVIRKRAYTTNYVALDNSYTTEQLIAVTNMERAKELFMEGDRLFYLQATKQDLPCGDRENCSVTNSADMYWKIPESEIHLNNNIDQ